MQKWAAKFLEKVGLMSEYVTLEEAAKARGESPDTIAWLMTTKDCKIYLRFDESQESSIAISTYEGLPNHHSLYVIERGCYPLALEAQNELYQRLVEGNFDIDHLYFHLILNETSSHSPLNSSSFFSSVWTRNWCSL